MDAKRPPLPLVLTANDLLGGQAVYFGADGWTDALASALVAADDTTATALEAQGRVSIARADVVDPYLTTVALDAGVPTPAHYRERIRASGPTIAYGPIGASHVPV